MNIAVDCLSLISSYISWPLRLKVSWTNLIEIENIPESGRVIFGATVTLFEMSSEKKVTYKIVGEDEADVKKGKISYSSPISKALIGKEEGEIIKFETPSGFKEYEIVSTKHS